MILRKSADSVMKYLMAATAKLSSYYYKASDTLHLPRPTILPSWHPMCFVWLKQVKGLTRVWSWGVCRCWYTTIRPFQT